MAANGIEIESRFRVDRAFARDLERRLLGFESVRIQEHEDTYFDGPSATSIRSPNAPTWLSLRKRDSVAVNVKVFEYDKHGDPDFCHESEVTVGSADEATRVLQSLGYVAVITVHKRRVEATIGAFSVSLDHVSRLGWFVEVEAVVDFGSVARGRAEVGLFSRELGLTQFETAAVGYPTMLMQLDH